jgi:hypothetical protein
MLVTCQKNGGKNFARNLADYLFIRSNTAITHNLFQFLFYNSAISKLQQKTVQTGNREMSDKSRNRL